MFRARTLERRRERSWLRWLAWLAYPMGLIHGALLARFFGHQREEPSPEG